MEYACTSSAYFPLLRPYCNSNAYGYRLGCSSPQAGSLGGETGMQGARLLLAVAFNVFAGCAPAFAVEGPTAAGPIGGTDIRSAVLPGPGAYGGAIALKQTHLILSMDTATPIPALADANLDNYMVGPFLYFVYDAEVARRLVGVGGILPLGTSAGTCFLASVMIARLVSGTFMWKWIGHATLAKFARRDFRGPIQFLKALASWSGLAWLPKWELRCLYAN